MPFFFKKEQNIFLKKNGFEIHLIATNDSYLQKIRARDGIIIHPLTIKRRPSLFSDLSSLIGIVNLLRKIKPDIVHAGAPKSAFLGMIAAWLCRIKGRFFACHGTITARRHGLSRLFYRLIEKLTASLACRVWCVSPSLLDFLVSEGIVSKNKAFVIGQGSANGFKREWLDDQNFMVPDLIINLRNYKLINNYLVILYTGRICIGKGIKQLLEAWLKIKYKYNNIKLLLIGAIDYTDLLDETSLNLIQTDDSVTMTGYIDPGALGFCYETADLLVLPSVGSEGFPNVIGEAGIFSLPVVATNIIGSKDAVVDGVTGTLVPPADSNSLYNAISNYLENHELARNHGIAARNRIETFFTPELIWETLKLEYINLLR
jgi:glycosyltransferase involved in cell wall biosynthesis